MERDSVILIRARISGIKVVPRSLALWVRDFLYGGERMDWFGGALMILGAIMVYQVNFVFKVLKIKPDVNKIIVLKLIGLIVSTIGALKILDVIK